MKKALGWGVGFIASIYLANWMTTRWGVWTFFGVDWMTATAGTVAAGLTFSLRDALHERAGVRAVVPAILVGAGLSWYLSPALALASGGAFLLSEFADLALYAPLRENRWKLAVVASNTVGSAVDTVTFLWLASFSHIPGLELTWDLFVGQMAVKTLMILPGLAVVWWVRKR